MATLPGLTINAPADAGEGSAGSSNLFRYTVNKIINVAPACSVGWRVGGDVDASDFVAGQELSGRLTLPAGSSQGFIDLLVAADAKVEPNESLTVELFDPTGCILVKQPAHGTVTVTDLYQVTYTPNAGFVGTDTFDYLVKNSDGQIASSTVEVTITSAGPAAFPNGFEKKIEAFVGPDSEAMTGFELLFSIVDPALRTQANGGVVRSNTGQDIRLEDGIGIAIPYARLRYNPTTGQVVGIAKRNRATGSTWNNIELFAGNTKMVVEEANPAAALSALLACWRMDNGQDLSGNSRHLTVSQNMPTGQTLFETPAGDFDRALAQQAELANPSSWLNGLAAFSLAMDLQVDQIASDSGVFRTGGTVAGAENLCSLAIRPESTAFYTAGVSNMFFAFVKIGATDCRIEGSTNSLRTGVPTTLALTWASGQAITQIVDDAVITLAYNSSPTPAGTLTVPDTSVGKPLTIAGGPRGSFDGKVGLVRLAATRRSNAWLKAEQRNRLYPKAMLAWGEAVGPNDTAACVAFPGTATASGPDLTLSPLASTPAASGTGLRIISASAERGTVSLVAVTAPTLVTQLLYKQPTTAGVDHVTYTIQDSGGRKSSSLLTVTVSGTALKLTPDTAPDTTGVTPVSIPVQTNDEGVGRHITNADVTPNAAHRVVTIVGSGDTATLTYTPVKPFFGADTFTYEVTDGASTVARADVSVTVRRPPISARDASSSVTAGAAAIVISPSLGSDLGVDLIISARDAPSKGTADIITNATQIRYTPPSSVTGSFEDIRFKYTVRDAYSQTADAFITVRVNAQTVVVDAMPDTYPAVTAGTAVATLSPSPLANDTPGGVGGSLTIQALPGSGAGSAGGTFALVSAAKGVSYTPPASVAASVNDTIEYTISNNAAPAVTDHATITVPVNPVSVPDRPRGPLPASDAMIVNVSTTAQLQTALNNATAGQHIRVAPGTYSGPFNFGKTIAAENKVVIEGWPKTTDNSPGAILTGQYAVGGQGYWFHELTFNNSTGGIQLRITGSQINVTRCWFRDDGTVNDHTDSGAGIIMYEHSHHLKIGYCRFTIRAGIHHIKVAFPDNTAISATNAPHDIAIYRNYFSDTIKLFNSQGEQVENHVIYFGNMHMVFANDTGFLSDVDVEENYIENGTQRMRQVYLKRGCRLTRNRARGNGNFGFRHGANGRVWGNRVENGQIALTIPNMDVRKNVWTGAGTLASASAVRPPPKNPGWIQGCDNSLFVANAGAILFGEIDSTRRLAPPQTNSQGAQPDNKWRTGNVDGVNVWQHTGTITRSHVATGGVIEQPGTYAADNLTAGITTIPTTWDGNNTGFETGNQSV